jgi:magnesium transporter
MQPLEAVLRDLVAAHPDDAARAVEQIKPVEAAKLLERLPAGAASSVFDRLTPGFASELLSQLGGQRANALLSRMAPEQVAAVLRQLPEEKQQNLIEGLDEEARERLRKLLSFDAKSAGGIMDPQVAAVPLDLSVKQAVQHFRKAPRATVHYLYVTDRDRKLIGVLNIRDLLLADPQDRIEAMVNRDIVTVKAGASSEDVAHLMQERKFLAVPVVAEDGEFLGVVRQEQMARVLQAEAFEDLQRMVGAGGEERALAPVLTVVSKRLPWLCVNLGTAFLASAVVGLFSGILAQVTMLAVLLPVVAGQGGNAGAQSLAIVIRGLAVGELGAHTTWRVLRKELLAGILNGIAVAIVTALAVYAWQQSLGLSMVIGLAMIVNMAAAAVSGASIPLILNAVGKDPAQSSSIFMTTVTDVVGFASFLGFAMAFSGWLA